MLIVLFRQFKSEPPIPAKSNGKMVIYFGEKVKAKNNFLLLFSYA
jgi:hypothetical protein